MTTRDIISKLTRELDTGITSEVQVVYLLAGVRKLIERDGVREQFSDLNFHCDWTLHSKLEGTSIGWIWCGGMESETKGILAHRCSAPPPLTSRDLSTKENSSS